MIRASSKAKNLSNHGDNLSLKDLKEDPDNPLYNHVIDTVVEERGLGNRASSSSPNGNHNTLEEMANQFDKQRAEEAVEQYKIDNDELAQSVDSYGRLKRKFQNERAQEIFERILNQELTDIEELLFLAESNTDGLLTNSVDFNGKSIKIIHVFGYPIRFLKSLISGPVLDAPYLWERNDQELQLAQGERRSGKKINSSTICTTYVDTDSNISMSWNKGFGLTYIFSRVKPDSVIKIGTDDVWSHANDGEARPQIIKDNGEGFLTPKEIATKGEVGKLNEVTLRRYDDTGKPLLPNAILLTSGYGSDELTERILKQAAHFDIPIIHLDVRFYRDEYGNIPDDSLTTEISEHTFENQDVNNIIIESTVDSVERNIGPLLQRGASKTVIKEKLQSEGDDTFWKNTFLLYGL